MSIRMLKVLIFSLLLAAVVSYLFYWNPGEVTVNYAGDSSWKGPMALVLVACFFFGAGTSALLGVFFGLQLHFLARRMRRRYEMVRAHQKQIVAAREQLALANCEAAKSAFAKIVERDPEDIAARIHLAQAYYQQGELAPALQVLEKARREQKKNAELLLLAADVSAKLGNYTTAIDNAALALAAHPRNSHVLQLLVQGCRELERFDEAIAYQTQLLRLVNGQAQTRAQELLAELEVLRAQKLHETDKNLDSLESALEEVLRRHREFPGALRALAQVECEKLNLDAASKHWTKLFQLSGDFTYLRSIAQVWLHADNPSRAVSVVKNAISQRDSERESSRAQLFLVALLQHLEMIDRARDEFKQVRAETLQTEEEKHLLAAVQACFLSKEGKLVAAVETLASALNVSDIVTAPGRSVAAPAETNGAFNQSWVARLKDSTKPKTAPSPRLSTP